MEPTERQELLAETDPARLFGVDPTDPRALRRAWARLAKRWRDDAEVSAHLRSCFEGARDGTGPTPPEGGDTDDSPEPLPHDLDGLAARFARDRLRWRSEDPDRLLAVLSLLARSATLLPLERVDLLEGTLEDPSWELGPGLHYQLLQRLWLARALAEAERGGAVPAPVLDLLRRGTLLSDRELAQSWLTLSEELPGDRALLHDLFSTLEEDHPALFAEWVRLEERLAQAAAELPVPTDLRERLSCQCHPVSLRQKIMDLIDEHWPGLFLWWLLYVFFQLFVPVLLAVPLAVFLVLPLCSLYRRSTSGTQQAPPRHFPSSDTGAVEALDALEEAAREHGFFPRELAAAVSRAPELEQSPAYGSAHPLVLFDQDPSALLRAFSPAHLARFEEAP